MMKTSDFDYDLRRESIAQYPSERRDESRLLVLERDTGGMEHRLFKDILDYLAPGDVLVVNESEVIPARFIGEKKATGGKAEMFLLKETGLCRWEVLVRPGTSIREGAVLSFGEGLLEARVLEVLPAGKRIVELVADGDLDLVIAALGQIPLPPYIERRPEPLDRERYQTVYARVKGAVAAPTAGLHFTDEILDELADRGVGIAPVILHVGLGTFRPVSSDDPEDHEMDEERYEVSDEAASLINAARDSGGKIVAVGTTCVRVLESVADDAGKMVAAAGSTDLFIRPGYRFRCVDALITNFHLPKSTLLMLVAAFGGYDEVMAAYREAVERNYRFYSYGDAMLVL